MMAERFSVPEVAALRNEMVQSALDSQDAAAMMQLFLMGRGYGVSPEAAIEAARRVGIAGCSIASIQQELNRIALVQ